MTGRRLYDYYCDARAAKVGTWNEATPCPAWAYLKLRERQMWNEMACRLPKRRKAVTR